MFQNISEIWFGRFMKKVNWLPFEEAREIVRKLKLANIEEYKLYLRKNKNLGLPTHPDRNYNKKWISWIDWFGKKGRSGNYFLSFEEAHKIVLEEARKYNIFTFKKWQEFCRSDLRIKNIPSYPSSFYKGNGWVSFPNWLGSNRRSLKEGWTNFEEAREIAKTDMIGFLKSVFQQEI